jgi:hypothetical protein
MSLLKNFGWSTDVDQRRGQRLQSGNGQPKQNGLYTIPHGIQKWSKGAWENGLYRPRQPENSGYDHCVEDDFEDFEQVYEERFERAYGFCRPYLRYVIYRYLDCGILRNGFARVRCGDCGREYLLAFVLKRSGNPVLAGQAPTLLSFLSPKAGG